MNGLEDLRDGRLRLLGEPVQRYREDPVRMLRAVRFAARLGFIIDPACETPLIELPHLLESVPAARLFDEALKLFLTGHALQSFEKLRHYGLFAQLFPATEQSLSREEHAFPITFVSRGMENTDARVAEGKPVTPAFLFAVLLWEPVRLRAEELERGGASPFDALREAGDQVVAAQNQVLSIPKRFSYPMREIWTLQYRFGLRTGKRPQRLLTHPRFRAAYDFLLLRAESGETDPELAQWWTELQTGAAGEPTQARQPSVGDAPRKRRRRRRRPKANAH